jgi:serine/threonine protein kinase
MKIARGDAPEELLGVDLPPGTEVAGFLIEGRLATGSFGALFQARRGGKRFAVKLVPRDARGEREVDALRRVRELPVVGFHGYGLWPEKQPRFIVLALELVEGVALDAWARDYNPSTFELLTQVMLPLVSVLGQVHAAGVVHRDVKEANIVVRWEDGHPVLVDFGAAGYAGAPRLTLRLPPGTPEYRSPEVVRFAREWQGEPPPERPGDDLWALGVTLYVLLTRTLPFGDRHGPLADTILEDAPEPPHVRNPRVPPRVSELCLRMLAKAPEERYADASALTRDLKDALAGAEASWHVPLFDGGRKPMPPPEPLAPLVLAPEPVPAPRASRAPRWWHGALVLGALASLFLVPLTLLQKLAVPPPAPQAVSRHEIAPTRMTGEVVSSAGLQKSPPPAPVAHATHSAEQPMRPSPKNRSMIASTLAAALCTAPGCVSAPKLGPPMTPAPCPPGSKQTHEALGVFIPQFHLTRLENYKMRKGAYLVIPVRSGPISTELIERPWGEMPIGTVFKGQLYVREARVYGRFTEVTLPGEAPMPVCMELMQDTLGIGAPTYGGTPENPNISSALNLMVTDEFQKQRADR